MESNYNQGALVREWLCAVFSSPSGSAQQEGQNFFQPFVRRLIITSPQPVNTCAQPARQLLWDPAAQDGVAFSVVCGSVTHVTPRRSQVCQAGVIWLCQLTVKCSFCNIKLNRFGPATFKRSAIQVWSAVREGVCTAVLEVIRPFLMLE